MQVRLCFGFVQCNPLRRSWKTFVLEVWIPTFCESLVENVRLAGFILSFNESLVENVRFGSVDAQFLGGSRGKHSFWKCGFSVSGKVSWKTFVLEVFRLSFFESLVENALFGSLPTQFLRKSRGKRLLKFGRFQSQFLRKSRGKRSFWEEGGLKPRFQTKFSRKGV